MSEVQRREFAVENIPAELKQGRHWLCWRLEQVKDRWTKVPYRPFEPLRYWRSHPEITGIALAFAEDLYLLPSKSPTSRTSPTGTTE